MLSYVVHLKNKYPLAQIHASESGITVYQDGELLVQLRKSAHGALEDVSEQMGARDKFCLAPIPREARHYKLCKSGKIICDEHSKQEGRQAVGKRLASKHGRVPSVVELYESKEWSGRIGQKGEIEGHLVEVEEVKQ